MASKTASLPGRLPFSLVTPLEKSGREKWKSGKGDFGSKMKKKNLVLLAVQLFSALSQPNGFDESIAGKKITTAERTNFGGWNLREEVLPQVGLLHQNPTPRCRTQEFL